MAENQAATPALNDLDSRPRPVAPLRPPKAVWASWTLGPVTDVQNQQATIRKWRNGAIWAYGGELGGIWGRWWPYQASWMESLLLQRWKRLPDDHCWIYYSLPKNSPGFLSLRFMHTGHRTRLTTINRALCTLDEIAKLLNLYATVCTASNLRLSEKLMLRWGFERHAKRLPGLHFIKRYRAQL